MHEIELWKRRHAVQIASQLPERKEDALEVLEQTTELVTGFLHPANGHSEIRLITSRVSPIGNVNAMALSLLTLFFTTPIAVLAHYVVGGAASLTFGLGVMWSANRFGWRGAFPLVLATLPVHNFFIAYPPLGFSPLTPVEYYALGCLLVMAFMREAGDLARNYIEPWAERMILRFIGAR
jgi:hypothetical protein